MEKISTGSYDLNKWLYGGYEKGITSMIAGPAGSGKTNFCILAACSQAKKGKKVIFIDSEGGFSLGRVKQIVGSENYKEILENILLLEPTSFEEQKKAFDTLVKNVKKGHVGLIVVDSMAMQYRLELGDAVTMKKDERIKEVNREAAKQMKLLSEISRKQDIPILITNQVYESFVNPEDWKKGVRGDVHVVGGDLFKYWCKCIIELRIERGKRKAILMKHRSLPEKEISFEIKDLGVFRRGFL